MLSPDSNKKVLHIISDCSETEDDNRSDKVNKERVNYSMVKLYRFDRVT